ncbi:GAP family protein [Aeromicrobium sp. UC242_57]|uniref:GAP family protein n=1 Tax=Aeromicrobium sp. UC242_57 TaxID=3374624 RepID=UPI0037950771
MDPLAAALGAVLPAAVGVAISPLPIIASVLMLLSAKPTRTAPAFAAGWLIGLTAVTVIVLLLAGPSAADTGGSPTATSWIKLALGLVFLLLAFHSWQTRPRAGSSPTPPKWMAGLDHLSPIAALGLGAALSGLNPKNLALTATGAVAIASADLGTAAEVSCVVVFVIVGSTLVVGPVIAFFVARDAMSRPLGGLKSFMQDHNAAIMTVLLTVLGVSDVGKGLGGLLG